MKSSSLRAKRLVKQYPGTRALDDVSIEFHGGRVHALLGKNGAGKSTLVKILSGAVAPTSGSLDLDGVALELASTSDSREAGIATVYQELSLVPELSIAENMYMGRLPKKKVLGAEIIDWEALFANASSVLKDMEIQLDVRAKVSELGVAKQQVVEIAKGMTVTPKVLMLDEPTSALSQGETDALFKLVKRLASKGVIIIYITHRLHELRQITDDITVLRDGLKVETVITSEVSNEDIVSMLFGETKRKSIRVESTPRAKTVLSVRKLGRAGVFSDVSFDLAEGEILGIAGMLGAGRTELLKAIYGLDSFDEGEVVVDGRVVTSPSPMAMKGLGLAFISENRKEEGLVLEHSIAQNMGMPSLARHSRFGVIDSTSESQDIQKYIDELVIKLSSPEDAIGTLSGGNQQKCIIGGWLMNKPKVILFDEPTRGIDVAAKQQIFALMCKLADEGISSIIVSSELEELELCHRVLVMKNNTITKQLPAAEVSAQKLFVECMNV